MVEVSYERLATIFKALSDETRLHIIDMLSCNELCAADILASFNLSQSTLSYHMKILIDAGVVNSQRNGLWTRYSINEATFADILDILPQLYKTFLLYNCMYLLFRKHPLYWGAISTTTISGGLKTRGFQSNTRPRPTISVIAPI